MTGLEACLLGLIQGLTEFLPVSSDALILRAGSAQDGDQRIRLRRFQRCAWRLARRITP